MEPLAGEGLDVDVHFAEIGLMPPRVQLLRININALGPGSHGELSPSCNIKINIMGIIIGPKRQ